MPRPFTRAQALQNQAFLKALRRTGNARLAARELGVHRATFTRRRAKHPAFAAEWDAALAMAHACLQKSPSRLREGSGEGPSAPPTDPRITRRTNGRLQLRAPTRRRLTREAEQAFLAALSATANIRLAARAAGFSHAAFYQRRKQSPAFAREMRLALEMGYERLEMALLASLHPDSHEDDAWRHNNPPPIPQMTANQALQLLYLHQKEVRLQAEPPHIKRRRGESRDAHSFRLSVMYQTLEQRDREEFLIAEAARRERGEPWLFGPEALPELPALDQVTGWSKAAAGKTAHDETRALFGGWRLKDWEEGKG